MSNCNLISIGYFQVIQTVLFLSGALGIKIAIAKILGIADDVSTSVNIIIHSPLSCWTQHIKLFSQRKGILSYSLLFPFTIIHG